MEFAKELVECKVENFIERCREEKFKVTPQRIEIFRALAATDEHPGVDEVYNRVRPQLPSVSKDTVYRTLALFEDIGVAIKVEQLCERVRYDADTAEHQHFLCERCGKIKDFQFRGVMELFAKGKLEEVGEVHSIVLQLRGICNECLAAEALKIR